MVIFYPKTTKITNILDLLIKIWQNTNVTEIIFSLIRQRVARTFRSIIMAIFIKYKSESLRDMVNDNYISMYSAQLAEEKISNIAETLIKSFIDRGYDPLEIIDIFSDIFDKEQLRSFIGFRIGMETLESLESKKES